MSNNPERRTGQTQRHILSSLRVLAILGICAGLNGCLMVGGSSRGGFFLFPGGLGLLVLVLLFVFLSRRR